jgi:hypothetical protein
MPPTASDSRQSPHPITPFDCAELLRGRARPVRYATATINNTTRAITILVSLSYRKPPLQRRLLGLSSRVTQAGFAHYATLVDAGLANHWSRGIHLNGVDYDVRVRARQSPNGLPLILSNPGNRLLGPLSCRSSNPYPLLAGNVYYDAGCDGDADAMFAMTAAHEIGHAFLTSAFGIRWSWGHQGTSSVLGRMSPGVAPYPPSGEIELMTYYCQNPDAAVYRDDVLRRTVASENDVKTLLYIAGRGTT